MTHLKTHPMFTCSLRAPTLAQTGRLMLLLAAFAALPAGRVAPDSYGKI